MQKTVAILVDANALRAIKAKVKREGRALQKAKICESEKHG